jgi:4-amino-4-deoxy-L-arabinose transferase-like glycosyltransferase
MPMQQSLFSDKRFCFFVFAGILINATGLFNEILEPDGALYAFISKQICQHNDWINLYDKGLDWLDKPHLPFWLTAISFKLFGISAFTYKLPSFLCWMIGTIYIFRLTKLIYNKAVAQAAVLIYVTLLYVIIPNFDVRAEGFLTAFVIAAIYHIYKAHEVKWFVHVLIASVFCALAMMTKGIFVLITISSGFLIYWLKTKQWNRFIQWRWYLLLALSFIFIFPELYALYVQFDLHPEKIIFGKTHVSGIRFFFWDSQFGRFVNNGPIKGNGDIFFFLHTTLWEFLPWTIVMIVAVFSLFKKRKESGQNDASWILGGSAFITFLLFSFSKFQLPHYIIIVFPQLAIITADYLLHAKDNAVRKINVVQTVLFLILCILIIGLAYFYIFQYTVWLYVLLCGCIFLFFLLSYRTDLANIFRKNILFAVLIACFLNLFFYPSIMKYQAGMMAGKWLSEAYPGKDIFEYKVHFFSLEFYSNGKVYPLQNIDSLLLIRNFNEGCLVFTTEKEWAGFRTSRPDLNTTVLKTFKYYHVTELSAGFLNHHTRDSVLQDFVVAQVKRKQ